MWTLSATQTQRPSRGETVSAGRTWNGTHSKFWAFLSLFTLIVEQLISAANITSGRVSVNCSLTWTAVQLHMTQNPIRWYSRPWTRPWRRWLRPTRPRSCRSKKQIQLWRRMKLSATLSSLPSMWQKMMWTRHSWRRPTVETLTPSPGSLGLQRTNSNSKAGTGTETTQGLLLALVPEQSCWSCSFSVAPVAHAVFAWR